MDTANLIKLLETTGFPFVFNAWTTDPPGPPYGAVVVPKSHNFYADGEIYLRVDRVCVELYTAKKDPAAERAVETVLEGAGTIWKKTGAFIVSERLFAAVYEFEVEVKLDEQ